MRPIYSAATWPSIVVKPGPLAVQIRYNRRACSSRTTTSPILTLDDCRNTQVVGEVWREIEDPRRRIRDSGVQHLVSAGRFPWAWDFGTGSAVAYGAFRNANDSAVLAR